MLSETQDFFFGLIKMDTVCRKICIFVFTDSYCGPQICKFDRNALNWNNVLEIIFTWCLCLVLQAPLCILKWFYFMIFVNLILCIRKYPAVDNSKWGHTWTCLLKIGENRNKKVFATDAKIRKCFCKNSKHLWNKGDTFGTNFFFLKGQTFS